MTDTMFTRTALTEAAKHAGVTTDQARTILEAAGVKVQPEKPALPTEPGSVIIATEVRGVTGKWRMLLDDDGEWSGPESIGGWGHHCPDHITAWTETVVLPAAELEAVRAAQDTLEELAKMGVTESDRGSVLEMAARLAVHGIDSDEVGRMVRQHYSTTATAPVTLTEDQVGEVWDAVTASDPEASLWVDYPSSHRARFKAVMNAALAQHAAPAEGEPIDLGDVREGDRVRVVLVNGDEATITVEGVWSDSIDSPLYSFHPNNIRAAYLLDREEA